MITIQHPDIAAIDPDTHCSGDHHRLWLVSNNDIGWILNAASAKAMIERIGAYCFL